MSLLNVRDEFITKSGRYDLGTVSDGTVVGVDDGANWYIQAGQKWLDRRFNNDQHIAKRVGTLAIGEYLKIFRQARIIMNVWLIDQTTGDTNPMDRRTYAEIRDFFGKRLSVLDAGTPGYWAPAYVKMDPGTVIDDLQVPIDTLDEFVIDSSLESNGIVFAPPSDTAYYIDILGKWYSNPLEADGDVSMWTEGFEHVLVWAAQRQLEVSHRNTEGVRDWTAAIDDQLSDIDKDEVAFDTEEINQMEG